MKVSNYIKSKIKGKSWKDKKYVEYVEELMKMEAWIRRPPCGVFACWHFHALKSRYEKEYLAILKEIDPKRYEKEKQRLFEERKENLKASKEFAKEEREEEERDKKLWLELGGME